ncbi:aldo/keto reductase [Salinisphaera sp. Q1T1-3]|uniref:aldo/keto reductase n=1 Tax=Salinisphaera sp. Q1T1-3 TaxID=2321229 RepID=UPI000E70F922|nr:aldo/keto reductase [Salinisphaera sp. Q1T1-3]RJS93700.1 aldo/keto reductase [Salinisphaera sp. Q1T1-3]
MEYRTLGQSGLAVSKLALGTMYFGNETPEAEAFDIMDTFVEAGGTLIDTADVYVGGMAEQVIGRWFADRPREITDHVVLATKARYPMGDDVNAQGLSRRHLQRALDASLERLGVETIDLYQLHGTDPLTPMEETLAFLDDAVRAGKIHHIGLSNFNGWEIQRMASTAQAMNLTVPSALQPQYNLLSREIEWEIVPAARHNGMGLLPWSPLAGGLLTGKYERNSQPAADTRAGSDNPMWQWTIAEFAKDDRDWAVIDAVREIADQTGATASQVALAWLMARPGVTAPICGARTPAHIQDNLGAAELTLDAEPMARLNDLSAPVAVNSYPYGNFGEAMRTRYVDRAEHAVGRVVADGADAPLGTRDD